MSGKRQRQPTAREWHGGGKENKDAPRYAALSVDGECIEAGDSLDELLALLAALAPPKRPGPKCPDSEEDLCVWDGARIAAVVQSDGTVTRFGRQDADTNGKRRQ